MWEVANPAQCFAMRTCILVSWLGLLSLHADWLHWRGPHQNGILTDTCSDLPSREAWHIEAGAGGSTPLVVKETAYVIGWAKGRDTLCALSTSDGHVLWQQSYASPRWARFAKGDQSLYSGTTASPAYDAETRLLFTLGVDGDLHAWDTTKQGEQHWHLNLYDQFKMGQRPKPTRTGHRDYGFTTAPLIYENTLIVEVGSETDGNLMGFDKRTGKRLWTSRNRDLAGHTGGPVFLRVEGVPCVAVLTLYGLHVARLDGGHEGETVATYEWKTDYANSIASPAVSGASVLITSAYNNKAMHRVDISLANGATKKWEQRVASKICTPLIHEGFVYWVSGQRVCLNFATGEKLWAEGSYGDAGSMILAKDTLLGFADKGTLFLADADPRTGQQVRKEQRGYFRTEVWPHLVLSDGRLLLKDRAGLLRCFDLSAQDPASAVSPKAIIQGEIIVDLSKGSDVRAALRTRGQAALTDSGHLSLAGGAFVLEGYNQALLASCRATGQLTIETLIVTDNLTQEGPGRLISFSADPYKRNFTLGQEKDQLVLRLRTAGSDENGMRNQTNLCRLTAKNIHHVLVTYRSGELVCYLDGTSVLHTDRIRGDFSNWSPMHLIIGDEWSGERPWQGHLLNLKVESDFVEEAGAIQRFGNRRTGL